MSRTKKLIAAFKRGDELTADQIAARYNLANPTAVICLLRQDGYSIYSNRRVNSAGEVRTKYRLGTPKRSVVAAGVQALREAV